MNVFLCHALEDRDVAALIRLALVGANFNVFFDEQGFPPGNDYRSRSQEAIAQADVCVFLISQSSVAPGTITLSQLEWISVKWPRPEGRVLPVMIGRVPLERVPTYLRSLTFLDVHENVPAEVRASVEGLRSRFGRWARLARALNWRSAGKG